MRIFGWCNHSKAWWPRRDSDGADYRYCPDCNKRIPSKVQFGKPDVLQQDIRKQTQSAQFAGSEA